MKLLFLIFHGFNPANGISKKIHYQVEAFRANGVETHLCYLTEDSNGNKQRIAGERVIADYGGGIKSKILKRTEYTSVIRYVEEEKINMVYIRSDHNANPFTIRMLHRLKKMGIRILMEIPTYPYDREYVTLRMKINLWTDKIFRHRLARYLYRIVTFSEAKTIFGVPTIQISNGISFEDTPVKRHLNDTTHTLRLIGVAEIHYWHGYDRLIQGLAEYYTSNPDFKVYFHLIGDFFGAKEKESILPLITKYNLGPYVFLHGRQHGSELNYLFGQCDMGVGSLGRHRSGITHIKTLKNREYAARGIPFIYSETDEDFDLQPYVLKVSANESPIDIPSLITFYREMKWSPQEIRNSVEDLSWTRQVKKILSSCGKDF